MSKFWEHRDGRTADTPMGRGVCGSLTEGYPCLAQFLAHGDCSIHTCLKDYLKT